ncbi:type II secretion system F family protein [Microbulbifer bruguierae]|uniref:Type II secretion system F family protein n=1 Tax=Microbulbifer bruguierae TaxID=3029061 RepID=A0ABY8N938_9GAMM|nr:type II secretion system F family protein [Microbulbifer bruguierae]WGL15419.1 type II secretion system F family protein [Microbulbifer bruguierae]
MNLEFYKYWVLILIPISLVLLYTSIRGIKNEIPEEEREYLDPVPRRLRKIWPLVNLVSFYIGERLPVEWLVRYQKSLVKAGLNYVMSPAQYFSLQLTSATLMASMATFLSMMLGAYDYLYTVFGAAIGYVMPMMSVRDIRVKRQKDLVRSLPIYLDFLTLSTQAGLNISGAIMQSVDKGPESPMKVEFRKYLRDLRAGMSRDDGLRTMAERLDIAEINAFVSAVIQAEKTGASVGNTLKIQSDQRRIERFQKAEKLAMQAPVKLIFPLVVFIFPTTFIVIFFPIAMKLMEAL